MTTVTDRPTLGLAIQAIAGRCDGAIHRDDVGFNGPDSAFGRSLARLPEDRWDPSTRRMAWEMLRKYRGQLGDMGIDFDAIPPPADPAQAVGRQLSRAEVATKVSRTITVEGGAFVIRFRYDPDLVDAIKTEIPGRRWNAQVKLWSAPLGAKGHVLAFARKHGFTVLSTPRDTPAAPAAPRAVAEAQADQNPAARSITIEEDRFVIRVGGKTDPALAVVRELPAREYDINRRVWKVPVVEGMEAVLQFAARFDIHVATDATTEAGQVIEKRRLMRALSAADDAEIVIPGLTPGLTLRPYQRAGVKYILAADGRLIIGDDMGLGKTIEMIAAIQYRQAYPCVITCPSSLKYNWKAEFETWVPGIKVQVLEGGRRGQIGNGLWHPDVVVANFDILGDFDPETGLASGHLLDFAGLGIKALVVDESHYVKNPKALRTRAVMGLASIVPPDGFIVAMSGTPIDNRPNELIAQLKIIRRMADLGGSGRYVKRYCSKKMPPEERQKMHLELHERLRGVCYLRRKKGDVAKDLPEKARQLVPTHTSAEVMRDYAKAEDDVVKFLSRWAHEQALAAGATTEEARQAAMEKALRAKAAEHLVLINTLKALVARAKLPAAIEWIQTFLDGCDRKLVVFAEHTEIVDAICDKFDAVKIQGGQQSLERHRIVASFQEDPSVRLIVLQMKAGGVGLTLTAASDVAFLEQGWTPGAHDQCEDRCHRIGATSNVMAHYLLTAGTIDDDIAQLIAQKRVIVDAVSDGKITDADEVSVLGELLIRLVAKASAA